MCEHLLRRKAIQGGIVGRVLGGLLVLLCATPAWSHAILLHTEPAANERLDSDPSQIVLIFNERVEPTFNSLRVLDQQGHRWDNGTIRVEDGDTVTVSLPQVKDGSYGVFWRVTSLDGHQVQGQFGFGVRADPPTDEELAQQIPQEQFVPQWYIPAVRGVELAALSLWIGGIAFLAIVLLPVTMAVPGSDEPSRYLKIVHRSETSLLAGGVIFLAAELLWLWGKTAALVGIPMRQAASWPSLLAVLTTTRLGEWWMVRAFSALGLVALSLFGFRPAWARKRWGAGWAAGVTVPAVAILASIAATGHAQAVSQGVMIAEAVDWIHLAATVVWIGGLVHLLMTLALARRQRPDAAEFLRRLTSRFSKLAQYCLLALVATGIYNTWLHLPSWSSFISSDYGRVLSAKLSLVLVIVAVAAMNRQRVLPALQVFARVPEKAVGWMQRLQKLVSAEVVLGGLILALVALLTNLPPAASVIAAGPVSLNEKNGDFTVGLKMDPNRVGKNQAVVTLTGAGGQRISDAKRVAVYLRSLDMDMGLETVEAQPSPDGTYQAEVALSMAGRWLVTVEVSPPRGDGFTTEFTIPTSM
jgi:copper transport protein